MIFDHPEMQRLRERYAPLPPYRQPKIVVLDRVALLDGERAYLEELLAAAPDGKHKDWLGRLLSDIDEQHAGAWFEIRLSGWLRNIGSVVIEPDLEGNRPDFVVSIADTHIAVEAQAYLLNAEEQERQRREQELLWILGTIQRPAMVIIEQFEMAGELDTAKLAADVTRWLDNSVDQPFRYEDGGGNLLRFTAQLDPGLQKVGTIGPTTASWANPAPLRKPLRKKASQHQALRAAHHPYVIALWLEDGGLSAEEVAEAWFGKTEIVVDLARNEVIEQRSDQSGAHFHQGEVIHTSVSGTLVFRANGNPTTRRHDLTAWYIQNPYARTPIDPFLFPTEASFVVVNQNADSYAMGWRRQQI